MIRNTWFIQVLLLITSNQCQLDSGGMLCGAGELSGKWNFKLWVIITVIVITCVEGLQECHSVGQRAPTLSGTLCFTRPARSPQRTKGFCKPHQGWRREGMWAGQGHHVSIPHFIATSLLYWNIFLYEKLWGVMTRYLILCEMKYFRISPPALFPEHSIYFCCTSTIDAEVSLLGWKITISAEYTENCLKALERTMHIILEVSD